MYLSSNTDREVGKSRIHSLTAGHVWLIPLCERLFSLEITVCNNIVKSHLNKILAKYWVYINI